MTLLGILLVALLVVLSYPLVRSWRRYGGTRFVRCPESGSKASIELDAVYAAMSQASYGFPILRVTRCSRWPAHQHCDRGCVRQVPTE